MTRFHQSSGSRDRLAASKAFGKHLELLFTLLRPKSERAAGKASSKVLTSLHANKGVVVASLLCIAFFTAFDLAHPHTSIDSIEKAQESKREHSGISKSKHPYIIHLVKCVMLNWKSCVFQEKRCSLSFASNQTSPSHLRWLGLLADTLDISHFTLVLDTGPLEERRFRHA